MIRQNRNFVLLILRLDELWQKFKTFVEPHVKTVFFVACVILKRSSNQHTLHNWTPKTTPQYPTPSWKNLSSKYSIKYAFQLFGRVSKMFPHDAQLKILVTSNVFTAHILRNFHEKTSSWAVANALLTVSVGVYMSTNNSKLNLSRKISYNLPSLSSNEKDLKALGSLVFYFLWIIESI